MPARNIKDKPDSLRQKKTRQHRYVGKSPFIDRKDCGDDADDEGNPMHNGKAGNAAHIFKDLQENTAEEKGDNKRA